ncbi:MAG: bifunctional riboflavin kinase/FAD synthetase [Bacilli bacterium]|nr:bifunctional riboflavin kinase/FAD synthetase [Bacilli bacterium]
MEVVSLDPKNMPQNKKPITLCLGTFDGVHQGHQRLLIQAVLDATYQSAVLLFDVSPASFLKNGKHKEILTSLEDKLRLMNALRIEKAYVVHVDEGFFNNSPEEFIDKYIKPLNIERIVVGTDFRFGSHAKGNIETLKQYFEVEAIPLLEVDGQKVSTQEIVSLIKDGRVKEAGDLMGHDYEVVGKVVEGLHNGSKIGFPTANLALSHNYVLPKRGVYRGLTYVNGIPHISIINVGDNPTVGELKKDIIESHLIDYKGDLYDKTVYVVFMDRIRDEIKFSSLDELKAQLQKDSIETKELLRRI